MLEHKISWYDLNTFTTECSKDDVGKMMLGKMTYDKVKFTFWAFIWVRVHGLCRKFGAKGNKTVK